MAATPTSSSRCPVCGGDKLIALASIERMPVFCNVQWPTADAAAAAEVASVDLVFCATCSHVYNRSFDAALMEYSGAYENSLHFSPTFSAFADELADRLVEDYDLRGKSILEIGCGKGEFLTSLCTRGGNRGFGFDASYQEERESATGPGNADVQFFSQFFTVEHANLQPDFLCCRHVLEHMADPIGFLGDLRNALGNREGLPVYFEVPNGELSLSGDAVWDIIYEHPSYFTRQSLARVFDAAGFRVRKVYTSFNDQFLGVEAVIGAQTGPGYAVGGDIQALAAQAEAFAAGYRERIAAWEERIAVLNRDNSRAALWGAGSKGVNFLNTVTGAGPDSIPVVVDINIHKQGKFVPGTAQPIVAVEHLPAVSPSVVIVMNPAYVDEIRLSLREAGLDADIVCA